MLKKVLATVFAFILLALVAGGVFSFFAYQNLFVQHESNTETRAFQITEGESFTSVALRLEAKQLIPSAFFLQLYSRVNQSDTSIQKGNYLIPEQLTPVQLVAFLSSGQQNLVRVTIPEGKTLRQVANILEESAVVSASDFLSAAEDHDLVASFGIPADTVEGYIFPDTYLFSEGYPADQVVRHLVQSFYDELEDIAPNYRQLSVQQLHDIVTMASIVEREYRASEEAPLIASVFYNRLEKGMFLESCATVVYVMTEIEGLEHPSRIFFRDLRRESPYNTYIHNGLPPGPIANPGRVALEAAFFPAESEYLFFVLESPDAPRHVFSVSYADHLAASQVYYIKLN